MGFVRGLAADGQSHPTLKTRPEETQMHYSEEIRELWNRAEDCRVLAQIALTR